MSRILYSTSCYRRLGDRETPLLIADRSPGDRSGTVTEDTVTVIYRYRASCNGDIGLQETAPLPNCTPGRKVGRAPTAYLRSRSALYSGVALYISPTVKSILRVQLIRRWRLYYKYPTYRVLMQGDRYPVCGFFAQGFQDGCSRPAYEGRTR